MYDSTADITSVQVEDLEEVLFFSEEDGSVEADKKLVWELSFGSQVDIPGEDKELSQMSSVCSQIDIVEEEEKDSEGISWKKKFEEEQILRKKEVEKTKSAIKNLKHARRSSCSLRVELREMKRRCIENEEVMRRITVLSQEHI